MLGSFRHKGLRRFQETGSTRGIDPAFAPRIGRILDVLDAARELEQVAIHRGYRFHALQGRPRRYAMRVSGNWRITFEWHGEYAEQIALEDYH